MCKTATQKGQYKDLNDKRQLDEGRKYSGYRRLYLCDRFFEQKMAENEDKNTNRLENNGSYSSISLVSVIQILASTK